MSTAEHTMKVIKTLENNITNNIPNTPEIQNAIIKKLYLLYYSEILGRTIDPEEYKDYADMSVAEIIEENRELKKKLSSFGCTYAQVCNAFDNIVEI